MRHVAGAAGLCLLALTLCLCSTPTAADAAYVLPLEMRHGALRTRSSSESGRNLLGAGKVQVLGRWVNPAHHYLNCACCPPSNQQQQALLIALITPYTLSTSPFVACWPMQCAGGVLLCHAATGHASTALWPDCGYRQHHHLCALPRLQAVWSQPLQQALQPKVSDGTGWVFFGGEGAAVAR
jgi:hypothetical protein